MLNAPSPETHAVVIGGGTMGVDVAAVFLRGGCRVTVVEPARESFGAR